MSSDKFSLRRIAAFISCVAFTANLITATVFIWDLLFSSSRPLFGAVIAQAALIAAVFVFAILLLVYARRGYTGLDGTVGILGWLYIFLSAALFGVISQRFIVDANYDFGQFVGYIVLIGLVAGMGYGVTLLIKRRTDYFSIPFMLVAVEQIILWLQLIVAGYSIYFGWIFIGNLLLFGYAGLLVLFFIIPPREVLK
jgi:hypothetical protein